MAPLPVASPTTWLLVRMWPLLSKTTPEPAPEPCWVVTSMLTTLGVTAAETADQSGAVALPCTTVGEDPWFWFVVDVVEVAAVGVPWSASCVTAYVPPLATTAASSATPTVWPRRLSRLGAGRLPSPRGGVGGAGGVGCEDWL